MLRKCCMFECAKQPLNKHSFVLFHPQNLLAGQGVLNDNNWHTVRFSRRASNLRLQVDNSTPVRGTLCMYQQHIFFALIRVVTCRWIFEISCSWYADIVEASSQNRGPQTKKRFITCRLWEEARKCPLKIHFYSKICQWMIYWNMQQIISVDTLKPLFRKLTPILCLSLEEASLTPSLMSYTLLYFAEIFLWFCLTYLHKCFFSFILQNRIIFKKL